MVGWVALHLFFPSCIFLLRPPPFFSSLLNLICGNSSSLPTAANDRYSGCGYCPPLNSGAERGGGRLRARSRRISGSEGDRPVRDIISVATAAPSFLLLPLFESQALKPEPALESCLVSTTRILSTEPSPTLCTSNCIAFPYSRK